ncbi:DHX8-like protein, partial [Mya arenaria]
EETWMNYRNWSTSPEFIIDLAEKNNTFEAFKKALLENGAEFGESLIANLLRLIQKMKPKPQKKVTAEVKSAQQLSELEMKKKLFPGLALPNEVREKSPELPEDKEKDKNIADSMMGEKRRSRSRSRSRSRDRRRSRSRDRKKKKRRDRSYSRSRSRSRSRDRDRNRYMLAA